MTACCFRLTLLMATLLCFTSASAQEAAPAETRSETAAKPEIRYKPSTEIDVDVRSVEGRLRGPVGVYSDSLSGSSFQPLFRLKTDFDAEILASARMVR
ncbi:MAG: hypothetical protein VX498_09815 [Myxococcota bacterium]|nr:hypothetical protein [Myxococcota bacterium]